jgi:hypothetical protein
MKSYPTQQILELACAAQRINGAYIKEAEAVYADDGVLMYIKQPNKILMMLTLDDRMVIPDTKALKVEPEDVARAGEIQKYYKRLLFAAIDGENEFLTTINTILSGDVVRENQFGYVACLPSVYVRDLAQNKVKKAARQVEEGALAEIGSTITDLDAEIISSVKSKNFEGWNIDAIINNKMASWMNKTGLSLGPAVIIKAKVKDCNKHWKHQNDVTRLHYVKVAQ